MYPPPPKKKKKAPVLFLLFNVLLQIQHMFKNTTVTCHQGRKTASETVTSPSLGQRPISEMLRMKMFLEWNFC